MIKRPENFERHFEQAFESQVFAFFACLVGIALSFDLPMYIALDLHADYPLTMENYAVSDKLGAIEPFYRPLGAFISIFFGASMFFQSVKDTYLTLIQDRSICQFAGVLFIVIGALALFNAL